MINKRTKTRTVCNREVTFSVDGDVYAGTVQNMGNYGASVSAAKPGNIPEGKKIRMTIFCDNQEEVKSAQIVWSEESEFGAKFIDSAG
jgi:hypothetical protein